MLQINTGKFFKEGPVRRNELRGIVYTNLHLFSPIETAAGRLLPVNASMDPNALLYEITELIEGELGVGALLSHGVTPYLGDFAAIVSFALNVFCTPSHDLASRLIESSSGVLAGVRPSDYIKRVYDEPIFCRDEDADRLRKFVAEILSLKRKSYRIAIRAIRAYNAGLHRLADNLELAYTLLVVSMEILVTTSGGSEIEWGDYNEAKRTSIDKALGGVGENTVRRVRKAILKHERPSSTESFCGFALSHLDTSYFRAEAKEAVNPIGLLDLRHALRKAYAIRSGYVHNLRELPSMIAYRRRDYGEVHRSEGETFLTLQGLTRLARHVITEYIRRQPKVETEDYDYRYEQSGIEYISVVDFDPNFWIHKVDDLTVNSGRTRFEGFLSQVVSCLHKEENSAVTNIGEMLLKAVTMFPDMNPDQRKPFVALCILFKALVSPKSQPNEDMKLDKNYINEIKNPSPEAMLVHLLLNSVPEWTAEEHQQVYTEYLGSYVKKKGLKAPPSLVAGCALELAERYRTAGDIESALELIASAVENYPGHEPLLSLEKAFDPGIPINWRETVFQGYGDVPDKDNDSSQT